MTYSTNWNYPTNVKVGAGRINELADLCKALGMKRPLLITDPGIAALPMLKKVVLMTPENIFLILYFITTLPRGIIK